MKGARMENVRDDMAAAAAQKPLLSLIRSYAAEKLQGERRVIDLRKRIPELRSEIDAVTLEIEDVKRLKETSEHELKGHEFELAMKDASVIIVEARNASIQNEISTVGCDVEDLKTTLWALRDEFIDKMLEFNHKIRKFQQSKAPTSPKQSSAEASSGSNTVAQEKAEASLLENEVTVILSQIKREEHDCETQKHHGFQLQQELCDLESKADLMKGIMKLMNGLQELTRQTSKLEEIHASFGEELQKRCICPTCQRDNAEALGSFLQKIGHT